MSAIPMQVGTWISTQWSTACSSAGTLTSAGLSQGQVAITALRGFGQQALQTCSGSLGAGAQLGKEGLQQAAVHIQHLWSMTIPAIWKIAAFLRTSTGMACSGSSLVLCSAITAMYSESKVVRAAAITGTIAGGVLLGIAAMQTGLVPICLLAVV